MHRAIRLVGPCAWRDRLSSIQRPFEAAKSRKQLALLGNEHFMRVTGRLDIARSRDLRMHLEICPSRLGS